MGCEAERPTPLIQVDLQRLWRAERSFGRAPGPAAAAQRPKTAPFGGGQPAQRGPRPGWPARKGASARGAVTARGGSNVSCSATQALGASSTRRASVRINVEVVLE